MKHIYITGIFIILIVVLCSLISIYPSGESRNQPVLDAVHSVLNKNNLRSSIHSEKGDGVTEYWALLVCPGVYADYPDQSLEGLFEDVNDLYVTLLASSQYWSADHIKKLTGKDATLFNVIAGLRWLDQMDDGDDIALVYISTHGISAPFDVPPRDEEDGFDEVFLTYWGFAYKPLGVIWDDELNFYLSSLDSKGVCLVMYTCQSGGFIDALYWKGLNKPQHVVITACAEDEKPTPSFLYFFIDGLRGYADTNSDGIVSAEEAFRYADNRIIFFQPMMVDEYTGDFPLTITDIQNDKINPVRDAKTAGVVSEGSVVCGYVIDQQTQSPIENAYVNIYNEDGFEGYDRTNFQGFYSIPVVTGEKRLSVSISGYFSPADIEIVVGENATKWMNISLEPWPLANATICGYITDNSTGDPIEDANIHISGDHTHYSYYTTTDGFYLINVSAGKKSCSVSKDEYFPHHSEIIIDDNELLWKNISLDPLPEPTSVVYGFISNNITGSPIDDASIHISGDGTYYSGESNEEGFYLIIVSAGEKYISVYKDGFYSSTIDITIKEYEVLWINISLDPQPPQNSLITGYITDSITHQPINFCDIEIDWKDDQGHEDFNYTSSDLDGFYSIRVPQGGIEFFANKKGYFEEYQKFTIHENETIWINLTLTHLPAEDTQICGYVIDPTTRMPLENAFVYIEWHDGQGRYYDNYSETDDQGYYELQVASGEVHLWVYQENYNVLRSHRHDVQKDKPLWVNLSMDRFLIDVDIQQPLQAIYKGNQRILPFMKTLLLGDIDIQVDVQEYWYGINRVEFYIDGTLVATDTMYPYTWTWASTGSLTLKHQLKVVAYDNMENFDSEEITAWKLF